MSFDEEGKTVVRTEVRTSVNDELGVTEVKTVRVFDDGTKETTVEVIYGSEDPVPEKTSVRDIESDNANGDATSCSILLALTTHIRRVTLWELAKAKPLPSEAKRLEKTGVEN